MSNRQAAEPAKRPSWCGRSGAPIPAPNAPIASQPDRGITELRQPPTATKVRAYDTSGAQIFHALEGRYFARRDDGRRGHRPDAGQGVE
jgi:hypothetical protein